MNTVKSTNHTRYTKYLPESDWIPERWRVYVKRRDEDRREFRLVISDVTVATDADVERAGGVECLEERPYACDVLTPDGRVERVLTSDLREP